MSDNISERTENSYGEKIDWSAFENPEAPKSTIQYQLPSHDDYFHPTSSDFSDLDGFHSDFNVCDDGE